MERASHPSPLVEVLDGFELAHAMLGARAGLDRPLGALTPLLRTAVEGQAAGAARRAAGALATPLTPAHTRQLGPRAKALLGPEVGGATGRRWIREAPTRPGFSVHPEVRACVRALAVRAPSMAPAEDREGADEQ